MDSLYPRACACARLKRFLRQLTYGSHICKLKFKLFRGINMKKIFIIALVIIGLASFYLVSQNFLINMSINNLNVSKMEGPFSSVQQFCKEYKNKLAFQSGFTCHYKNDLGMQPDSSDITTVVSPLPPFLKVYLFITDIDKSTSKYHLAVETKKGWYVNKEILTVKRPGIGGIIESIGVPILSVAQIFEGGNPEILLKIQHNHYDSNPKLNQFVSRKTTFLVVCGQGESNHPSCTPVVPIFVREMVSKYSIGTKADQAKFIPYDDWYQLQTIILPNHQINFAELASKTAYIADFVQSKMKPLVGSHRVVFP